MTLHAWHEAAEYVLGMHPGLDVSARSAVPRLLQICRGMGALAAVLVGAGGAIAEGQTPDTILGRVTRVTAGALPRAVITVGAPGDSVPVATSRSDSAGDFRITTRARLDTFVVSASFVGYAHQTRVLRREGASQHTFRADFVLSPLAEQLGGIRIVAPRRRPSRTEGAFEVTPGSVGEAVDLSSDVSGDPAGGLASALSMVPGLLVTPSLIGGLPAISAFAAPADQSSVTLNSLFLDGADLPRDGLRARVVSSTYDPGKGGFSGVQVEVQLPSGGNLPGRRLHATAEPNILQWSPRPSATADTRYQGAIVSGDASGPVKLDHIFLFIGGSILGSTSARHSFRGCERRHAHGGWGKPGFGQAIARGCTRLRISDEDNHCVEVFERTCRVRPGSTGLPANRGPRIADRSE